MNTASRQRLRMQTPAGWWRDAFPLGNGAIGAMPYGRIAQERILLNHEKLWYCGCVDTLPDLSDLPAQQRELMKQKKFCEASDLYPAALRRAAVNRRNPYHCKKRDAPQAAFTRLCILPAHDSYS